MKTRKLQPYYQFIITITPEGYPRFSTIDGRPYSYNQKLTPSQWQKASQYLTRELMNFIGYSYKAKDEYKGKTITVK